MTQDHTKALAAVDACIDEYARERRARIAPFVEKHFSASSTLRLQAQSLVQDFLLFPLNAAWSIPHLLIRKTGDILEKLGWIRTAHYLGRIPAGIPTRYQREISRLVRRELLEWPHSLSHKLGAHVVLKKVFASGDALQSALLECDEVDKEIEHYLSSRVLISDLAGSLSTLALGRFAFGDSSLGLLGMGDRMARKAARDAAASRFVLGDRLGASFYKLFPPKPTNEQVAIAVVKIGLVLTLVSFVASLLSDPIRKALGLHQRRLALLIDRVEAAIYLHTRRTLKATRNDL